MGITAGKLEEMVDGWFLFIGSDGDKDREVKKEKWQEKNIPEVARALKMEYEPGVDILQFISRALRLCLAIALK